MAWREGEGEVEGMCVVRSEEVCALLHHHLPSRRPPRRSSCGRVDGADPCQIEGSRRRGPGQGGKGRGGVLLRGSEGRAAAAVLLLRCLTALLLCCCNACDGSLLTWICVCVPSSPSSPPVSTLFRSPCFLFPPFPSLPSPPSPLRFALRWKCSSDVGLATLSTNLCPKRCMLIVLYPV